MLTPQAVAERTFAKAKFGGYQMQEVDQFLDEITKDYRTLYEENASLTNNLKLLAGKINEYRETEDIMRATLHTAQKTADEIVAEAENKREAILDALEQDIRARKKVYDDEIAACRSQLAAAREKATEYIAMLQELTDRQQQFLSQLPDLGQGEDVEEPAAAQEEASDPASQEEAHEPESPAGDSIDEMIAQEAEPAAPAEEPQAEAEPQPEEPAPEEAPAADKPLSNSSRIDFSNLRFGKDYEIK